MPLSSTLIPPPKTVRHPLLPWYAAEFLISYSATLLLTGCYDYADKVLHATPSHRLFISASWGFAYIFISFLGGRITEAAGPRRAASTLAALSVLTCLLGLSALAIPTIWMIPLVLLPFNLTGTMIWPAIESGLTRTPDPMPLSSRMSLYNISWGSAGFLATFTHGLLEDLSFSLIFIVPALACTLAAVTLYFFAPKTSAPVHAEHPHALDPALRRRANLLLKMAWLTNPLAYVAIYTLIPVMTQLANHAGITNLGLAGVVGSLWFVVRFLTFALNGRWTAWHYKIRWQVGPLVALALSFAGMLLVPNLYALLAFQIVFGFCAAMLYSASLYYSMHVSSGKGSHAAFHEAVLGAGTMSGPLIAALAATGKLDHPAMQRIALAITSLLALGLLTILILATRKPNPSPSLNSPN